MTRRLAIAVLTLFACVPHPYDPNVDDILVIDRPGIQTVKIRGQVLRQNSEELLAGARVLIYMLTRPVQLVVSTDANGEFRARAFPAGEIGICVQHGQAWRNTGFRARAGQRFDVLLTLPSVGDGLDQPPCSTFERR